MGHTHHLVVPAQLPKDGALIKTIVTSNLADEIAKAYDIKLIECLTGFKYIGEQIKLFEQNHTYNYVFGLEESYGCLAGTYARDKDACVAVMMLCEVAAFYKLQGKTLWDAMLDMYEGCPDFYYKEMMSLVVTAKSGSFHKKTFVQFQDTMIVFLLRKHYFSVEKQTAWQTAGIDSP